MILMNSFYLRAMFTFVKNRVDFVDVFVEFFAFDFGHLEFGDVIYIRAKRTSANTFGFLLIFANNVLDDFVSIILNRSIGYYLVNFGL